MRWRGDADESGQSEGAVLMRYTRKDTPEMVRFAIMVQKKIMKNFIYGDGKWTVEQDDEDGSVYARCGNELHRIPAELFYLDPERVMTGAGTLQKQWDSTLAEQRSAQRFRKTKGEQYRIRFQTGRTYICLNGEVATISR